MTANRRESAAVVCHGAPHAFVGRDAGLETDDAAGAEARGEERAEAVRSDWWFGFSDADLRLCPPA